MSAETLSKEDWVYQEKLIIFLIVTDLWVENVSFYRILYHNSSWVKGMRTKMSDCTSEVNEHLEWLGKF